MSTTPFEVLDDDATLSEGRDLVLLAGDTHGDSAALGEIFFQAFEIGAKAIIQLGDFGFGWSMGKDGICNFSRLASGMSQETGIPLYWLDGNHEAFPRLDQLPVDPITGLRPILNGVTHLPRGSTMKIGNTTFRAFGGAYSVDIDYRTKGLSWWPEETCTEEDVENAIVAGPADIFLSHDCPAGVQDTEGLRRKLVEWGPHAANMSIINQEKVRCAMRRVPPWPFTDIFTTPTTAGWTTTRTTGFMSTGWTGMARFITPRLLPSNTCNCDTYAVG